MGQAHQIMGNNPDLGTSIQSAIHQVDGNDPTDNYMVPLNHELYYQSQERQDDMNQLSDDPMNLKVSEKFPTPSQQSDSRSESSDQEGRDADDNSDSQSEQGLDHDSDQEDLSA